MGTVVNVTSGNCDLNLTTAAQLMFTFTYFNNSQWSQGNETFISLGAATSYFPEYDGSDPYLIQGRGLYFSGSAYGVFGSYPNAYSSVVLPQAHSVFLWVRTTIPSTSSTLISKYSSDYQQEILNLYLTSESYYTIEVWYYALQGDVQQCVVTSTQTMDNAWHSVGYSVQVTSEQLVLTLYIDNKPEASTCNGIFYDIDPAQMTLGAYYNNEYSSYFQGFISQLSITPNALKTDPQTPGSASLGSYLETLDGLSCNSHCTFGCVRRSDCVMNTDPLCNEYSNFTSCVKCATGSNRWVDGLCHCKFFSYPGVDYSPHGLCTCPAAWPDCQTCPVFLTAANVTYVGFTSNFLGLEIVFSGFVNVSLHTSDCIQSFDASTLSQLGLAPVCKWGNETYLQVVFGVNATLTSGTYVHLLPQNYVTNVSDCSSIPAATMMKASIYAYPLISPKAKLQAPKQFSLESGQDLVLDGSGSSGFLNRPGRFQWVVSSDFGSVGSYSSPTFFLGKSVLRIPATALKPSTLIVTVTVINYLEMTSSYTSIVTVYAVSILYLSFNTPQMVTMTRATVRSFSVLPDVSRLPPNPVFTYKWSLKNTVPYRLVDVSNVLSATVVPNTLIIPKYALDPELLYIFRANVSESKTGLTGYLDLYVNMTLSNITISFSQVSGAVESWKDFSITATITDPDNLSQELLSIAWWCWNNSKPCSEVELKDVSNATLAIPAAYISPGSFLNITANITLMTKTNIQTLFFSVLDEPVPIVALQCANGKVNPGAVFRCGAAVTYTGVKSSLQWTLAKGQLPRFSGIAGSSLVIQPGNMMGGVIYTFMFTVTFGLSNRVISTEVSVEANSAPVNGEFLVSPRSGQELSTLFSFSSPDWEDDDLPLTYTIAYTLNNSSTKIKPQSEDQVFSSLLPAGNNDPSHFLPLTLTVLDALGTSVAVTVTVAVTPRVMNATELMSLLNNALNVSLIDLGSIPGTCTTIGPKVVSSSLGFSQFSAAYSSILDGLTQYSTITASADVDSAADCLQVFSASMTSVQLDARKDTLSLVTFLSSHLNEGQMSSVLGGKLLGSIGSLFNASGAEMSLRDVETTIENIGYSMMATTLPGEVVYVRNSGVTARLETHSAASLNGNEVGLGSNMTATFPQTLSYQLNLTSDSQYQLSAYSLPSNSSNFAIGNTVLKLDLVATGNNNKLYSFPIGLNVSELAVPITLTLPFLGLSLNSTNSSIVCRYYISINNTWSSVGITVIGIDPSAGLVTCNTSHLSVFSAGLSSAGNTAGQANVGQLGDFGNFKDIDATSAVGIYVCAGLWAAYIGVGIYAIIIDRRCANRLFQAHRTKAAEASDSSHNSIKTSSLFLKDIQARAAKAAVYARGETGSQPENTDTGRTIAEPQLDTTLDSKDPTPPAPPPSTRTPQHFNFKEMLLDEHMIVNIFIKYSETFPRFNRLTMFMVILMGELFTSGLFYNVADSSSSDTDVKNSMNTDKLVDSAESYSWSDFWVSIYSALIMIPIGFLLAYLLSRDKKVTCI